MAKPKKVPQTREEVLDQAVSDIRDKFGQGSIMRMGENLKANVEVISSGILPLDIALGIGGFPKGRVVELFGPEGSGKTTVALYAVAEAQKAGGVAAFIDAEHALDPRLAATVGVNIDALYLSQPDSGEQGLYILDTLVRSGAVDIVVVDSVAALTPQADIDGDLGENMGMGRQARLMSYALRRLTAIISKTNCCVIFINQLRAVINSGYSQGPTETTTGGRALKFYSSIRLEVRRTGKIEKSGEIIGHEINMKVVKNKQAPPFRTGHASLIYGKGIPKGVAVVDMAIDYGVLKKKGGWLAYKGETIGQGKENVATFIAKNPDLEKEIIDAVMAAVVSGLGYIKPLPESEEDARNESLVEGMEVERPIEVEEGIMDIEDDK
ncbi:protein RecA [Synergistales bacterium]|nr:protein RecA [Synergistales bacterium]